MTNIEHTPGPWDCDLDYIVAPDPNGIHPDIYIAEIADGSGSGWTPRSIARTDAAGVGFPATIRRP